MPKIGFTQFLNDLGHFWQFLKVFIFFEIFYQHFYWLSLQVVVNFVSILQSITKPQRGSIKKILGATFGIYTKGTSVS